MAMYVRQVLYKGMAALGAQALKAVQLPYTGIILAESHALSVLCILRTSVGIAWVVRVSRTPILVMWPRSMVHQVLVPGPVKSFDPWTRRTPVPGSHAFNKYHVCSMNNSSNIPGPLVD